MSPALAEEPTKMRPASGSLCPSRPADSWVRIGMLTPSSNTVLEPYTAAMLASFGERASAHFARFRVTEISMSDASRIQFVEGPILDATRLLADARVDVIAWNGTSASWLGFAQDEALCSAISDATGIAATSTILALNEILTRAGVRKLGLVTPYVSEVQEQIIANYAAIGIDIIADRRLEDRGNFSFAEYGSEQVEHLIRAVAESRPDAVAVLCTNFRGAPVVARLEAELGLMILDSVAITAWDTVRIAGLDPSRITGWGRFFQEMAFELRPEVRRSLPLPPHPDDGARR